MNEDSFFDKVVNLLEQLVEQQVDPDLAKRNAEIALDVYEQRQRKRAVTDRIVEKFAELKVNPATRAPDEPEAGRHVITLRSGHNVTVPYLAWVAVREQEQTIDDLQRSLKAKEQQLEERLKEHACTHYVTIADALFGVPESVHDYVMNLRGRIEDLVRENQQLRDRIGPTYSDGSTVASTLASTTVGTRTVTTVNQPEPAIDPYEGRAFAHSAECELPDENHYGRCGLRCREMSIDLQTKQSRQCRLARGHQKNGLEHRFDEM